MTIYIVASTLWQHNTAGIFSGRSTKQNQTDSIDSHKGSLVNSGCGDSGHKQYRQNHLTGNSHQTPRYTNTSHDNRHVLGRSKTHLKSNGGRDEGTRKT